MTYLRIMKKQKGEDKKENKNKGYYSIKTLIILLLVTAIIAASITIMVFSQYKYLGRDVIYTKVTFLNETKKMGIVLDNDALRFGSVPIGVTSFRSIVANNVYNRSIIVKISFTGNISKYINTSPRSFMMQPGETREIFFTVQNPADRSAEPGVYDGYVIMQYLRP